MFKYLKKRNLSCAFLIVLKNIEYLIKYQVPGAHNLRSTGTGSENISQKFYS